VDPLWEKHLAFTNFRRSIPPDIAKAVERFTNRQWALLAMCRFRERASELLVQTPALGFALAHHEKFRLATPCPAELAARLSRERQREIIRWLGFPGTQSWVNILSKIGPELVSLDRLLALRRASQKPAAEKMLGHLRALNAGVLALVAEETIPELLTPQLMAEVADSPEEAFAPRVAHFLNDIVNLRNRLQVCGVPPLFRSVESVQRKHQELADDYIRFQQKLRKKDQLPDPPVPGTAQIIPLTQVSQLEEEGETQHNCVESYVDRVKRGEGYIYRILAPERATLSIVRGPDHGWQIQQLLLACNQPVGLATSRAVQTWLDRFSISI
jgi:hypothetical protein